MQRTSRNNEGGIKVASTTHHHFSGREFQRDGGSEFILGRDYALDEMEQVTALAGIGFARGVLESLVDHAMDTLQQPLTTASTGTPYQFLQSWLPGIVEVVTAKQAIDEIVGRTTVGAWEDVAIVQQVIALTGAAVPYTDNGNIPLTSWNPTFIDRNLVRFELGLRVGRLEDAQASRMRVDSGAQKRRSDAIQLEIQRNAVGFYGYNSGANKTYGFLNDPNLPAYVNATNGSWATATFAEIQQDLLTAFQALRTQSKGRITPNKDALTLALPTSCVDYLATPTDFGYSVMAWLKEFYSNVRVVDAPQLDAANGGDNVFYVFADQVSDSGTDDQKTFVQAVPATFMMLGSQQLAKGYEEDYSNATAGVLCKRPYAVVRYSGI